MLLLPRCRWIGPAKCRPACAWRSASGKKQSEQIESEGMAILQQGKAKELHSELRQEIGSSVCISFKAHKQVTAPYAQGSVVLRLEIKTSSCHAGAVGQGAVYRDCRLAGQNHFQADHRRCARPSAVALRASQWRQGRQCAGGLSLLLPLRLPVKWSPPLSSHTLWHTSVSFVQAAQG